MRGAAEMHDETGATCVLEEEMNAAFGEAALVSPRVTGMLERDVGAAQTDYETGATR